MKFKHSYIVLLLAGLCVTMNGFADDYDVILGDVLGLGLGGRGFGSRGLGGRGLSRGGLGRGRLAGAGRHAEDEQHGQEQGNRAVKLCGLHVFLLKKDKGI